jgi:fumarate hydratase class I
MAFQFQKLFELGPDNTPWRKLSSEGVSTFDLRGRPALQVDPKRSRSSPARR